MPERRRRKMEEKRASSSPPVADGTTDRSQETKREESANVGGIKKACVSFAASLQQALAYIKAFFVGQGKKMTAKNEGEASEADLQASKIQVEATDAAEDTKART